MEIADARYVSTGPYMVATHWADDTVGSTFIMLNEAIRHFWAGENHPSDTSTFLRRWLIDAKAKAIVWLDATHPDPVYRLACTDEALVAMETVFPGADTTEIRMYCWQRQFVLGQLDA